MGKTIAIILVLLVALGAMVGALVYYASLPKNAAEQLAYAQKVEREANPEIAKAKTATPKDQGKIDALEAEIDAAYQEVITKYPGTPEAEEAELHLVERARLAGKLKGRELIERYEQFIKDHPESKSVPDLRWKIAEAYDKELNLKGEAIDKYRAFIDEHPDHERVPQAIFEIARIQEGLQEFEAAEKTYTELIEKHPEHDLATEAQYRRANLRADKLDKEKEAMEDFKEVEEKEPDSRRAQVAQARRREIGQGQAEESQKRAQEEYYGTQEVSYTTRPVDDWNDPTVQVIREQGVDTQAYDVAVKLDPAAHKLDATVLMTVDTTSKTLSETFIVQFNQTINLREVTQNGKSMTFEQKGNFLHMALAETMRPSTTHQFHFEYDGRTDEAWKGDVIDEKGTYLRPESRWYPYTVWGDEFTVELAITTPANITAIGPGLLVDESETTDTLKGDDGKRYRWKQEVPIGILALVAAEYERAERELRPGLVLQAYIFPEHESFRELYLDEMAEILPFYEGLFGPFPYAKMAVAEIPFFPGGYGSPTLLMITEMVFKDSHRVVAEFLAHEVSHQWFGNLVGLTLLEDSHPWLTEGFATYADALYLEKRKGRQAFIDRVRDMGNLYIESLLAFEDTAILDALWDNPMYRTLAYEKGGAVIHTLVYVMGEEKWREAMKRYIETFSHKTVEVADFQNAMEEVHGEDLDWFFDTWLRRTGFPHYFVAKAEATETVGGGDAGSGANGAAATSTWTTSVVVHQLEEPYFPGPIEVMVYGEDEESESKAGRMQSDGREATIAVETSFKPARVLLDPDAHILKYPSLDDTERAVKIVSQDGGDEADATASGNGGADDGDGAAAGETAATTEAGSSPNGSDN